VNDLTVPAASPWWRSGKLVVLGLAAILGIGWVFYRETLPPTWLHEFGSDISLRATVDPNAPLPEDAREATPRGLADNPLICAANVISQPWDRVVFVTHEQGKTLQEHPVLGPAQWMGNGLTATQARLIADDRYQIIALMDGGKVRDSQLFFTFWADLSGLARPQGFSPEEAIFTAASVQGRYVLSLAPGATLADCPK
jgi:hypothetical protein